MELINHIIYNYAGLIHSIFVTSFILMNKDTFKKTQAINIGLYIFILGHIIILVNLFRHNIKYIGKEEVFDEQIRNYGILGHGLLALSIVMQVFVFKNMDYNIYRILFIVGQIGMMLLYNNVFILRIFKKIDINNIKLLLFLIPTLVIFYIREAFISNNNILKIIFVAMIIVYINWIIYIVRLMDNKEYKFIN